MLPIVSTFANISTVMASFTGTQKLKHTFQLMHEFKYWRLIAIITINKLIIVFGTLAFTLGLIFVQLFYSDFLSFWRVLSIIPNLIMLLIHLNHLLIHLLHPRELLGWVHKNNRKLHCYMRFVNFDKVKTICLHSFMD